MSAEETEILVNPDLRMIRQITVDDVRAADKLFDELMGEQVVPRKNYIKEHAQEAIFDV